ncbi:organic cation transporter protein [Trichonephila inaurata madagascariensis]|uniref:Organic cation transporter protein n=1 Tax=Trichonephila inaurata madagascariensis TaxID=2747483 RepID=A0A8X7C6V6_9ARAC|nr:organic cation transporter protein [Trichonephila inaurata madagascariensis]
MKFQNSEKNFPFPFSSPYDLLASLGVSWRHLMAEQVRIFELLERRYLLDLVYSFFHQENNEQQHDNTKCKQVIPESPRWLLIKGKTDKLEKLLIKAAAINRREIKEDIKNLEMFKCGIEEEEKKNQTLWEVMKIPKLRNRTFNMIYIWIVNAFCIMDSDLPVPKDLPWISTSLALMGKFCVTGSFGLLYLYTAEIFPTGVRNVTLGSCSMWARVGSILAPFMRDLGRATYPEVPNVLYTLLALTSGLFALALPETRGVDLPNTFQESESLGKSTDKVSKENNDATSISVTEK